MKGWHNNVSNIRITQLYPPSLKNCLKIKDIYTALDTLPNELVCNFTKAEYAASSQKDQTLNGNSKQKFRLLLIWGVVFLAT